MNALTPQSNSLFWQAIGLLACFVEVDLADIYGFRYARTHARLQFAGQDRTGGRSERVVLYISLYLWHLVCVNAEWCIRLLALMSFYHIL